MKRLRSERGVTFVEVMVAILLVGVAATMYFQSFPVALRTRQTADYKKVATNAAQQKLEEIRDEARSVGGFYKISDQSFTVDGLVDGTGTVTVQDAVSGSSELKKVTVVVTWGGAGNSGGSVRVQTLISAFG